MKNPLILVSTFGNIRKLSFAIFLLSISSIAVAQSPTHLEFDALLKKHVTTDGIVNYKGFIADSLLLNKYLNDLTSHPPLDNWTENEKLAFWINAYNAFTIQLIIRHYPIKSIKDLGGKVYKINTPWDIKFIRIGNEIYDLNNLEHSILRKQFTEPRIHFALNCASKSCPKLRNEAYIASKLNNQLNDQAKSFINDSRYNVILENEAKLSRIFQWYRGDFATKMSFEAFISQWSPEVVTSETDISYMEYNWDLNE